MTRRRAVSWSLLACVFAVVVGCRERSSTRDWTQEWGSLARPGGQMQPGATLRVVTWTSDPWGVQDERESWRLIEADTAGGRFVHERAGRPAREENLRFHPAVPRVPVYGSGSSRPGWRGVYPAGRGMETVVVPAGRFRCARTQRSFEAKDGAIMAVDEWWAPNVPVPVQRWTRWNHYASDTLRNPPRRAEDLPVGTAWAVLERFDRR